MTYKDILIQIVSEATETPEQQIKEIMDAFLKHYPKNQKVHQEVSPEEAARLLTNLRKEKSQIQAIVAKNGITAIFRHYGNA